MSHSQKAQWIRTRNAHQHGTLIEFSRVLIGLHGNINEHVVKVSSRAFVGPPFAGVVSLTVGFQISREKEEDKEEEDEGVGEDEGEKDIEDEEESHIL